MVVFRFCSFFFCETFLQLFCRCYHQRKQHRNAICSLRRRRYANCESKREKIHFIQLNHYSLAKWGIAGSRQYASIGYIKVLFRISSNITRFFNRRCFHRTYFHKSLFESTRHKTTITSCSLQWCYCVCRFDRIKIGNAFYRECLMCCVVEMTPLSLSLSI